MGRNRGLLCVLLLASGCHSLWPDDDLVGDGHLVDVHPNVAAFTGVEIDNRFLVTIRVGPPELRITLDENIVAADIVDAYVDDRGILVIRQCDGCRDFAPSRGASISCASPRIDTIRTTGEVTVIAETATEAVTLDSSGESRLDVTARGARTVSVTAHDSARLALTTDAPTLSAVATGEATLHAGGNIRNLELTATDQAYVSARSSDAALVIASGEAKVIVAGEPSARTVQVSGEASVSFPAGR